MHVLANFEFNVTIKIYLLTFMQQDKRQKKNNPILAEKNHSKRSCFRSRPPYITVKMLQVTLSLHPFSTIHKVNFASLIISTIAF